MNNDSLPKNKLTRKKIPLSIGIAIVIIIGIVGVYLNSNKETKIEPAPKVDSIDQSKNEVKFHREKGFELTKPLVFTELPEQSPALIPIRDKISNYIKANKAGNFNDVSVHLLKQNTSEWIGVNQEKKYSSRGYLRTAVLITFLKMSETDPQILNRKIEFKTSDYTPRYSQLTLTPGKSYTVQKLLEQMMLTADTTPKHLLIPAMDKKVLISLYELLGMDKPDLVNQKFSVTVSGYSKLLNVIYNGSYLSVPNSEYVLKMLSNNTTREGLLKYIPEQSKVVHKVNLRFADKQYELRESGIIYESNETYLLTIFVTGSDTARLENTCGEIGKLIYDDLSAN